jgi:hypothetical protein
MESEDLLEKSHDTFFCSYNKLFVKKNVKQSLYTSWRRLGGEEV